MANLFLLFQKIQIFFSPTNCLNDNNCDYGDNEAIFNNKLNLMKKLYSNEPTKVETPLYIY
jgi:hypothetical protein